MKEYDRVLLTAETERYAKDGVHQGMDGFATQEILTVNGSFVLTAQIICPNIQLQQ